MSLVPPSVLSAALAAPGDVPIAEHDPLLAFTAAERQTMATGAGPDDPPAVFFVLRDPGLATLTLRAAGNAASELLNALAQGDRVIVRLAPLRPVEEREPRGGSWARRAVSIDGAAACLLVPGSEP